MKINNKGVDYYIPDDIGNDATKTVAELFAIAVPYELYELTGQLDEKEAELKGISISDVELLEWAKQNHPSIEIISSLEEEIENLNDKINNYGNNN